MLGVSGDADAAAIKAAFRSKAKVLHPDVNPSPIAAKQFQRLNDAYEILSDTSKRAAYDKTTRPKTSSKTKPQTKARSKPKSTGKAKSTAKPGAKQKPESKAGQNTGTGSRSADSAKAKPSSAGKGSTKTAGLALEACQCGKVTAQPRYIVFDMVAGRGRRVVRKAVAGVFCRTCADKAALKASYITWVAGWWAFPNGPRETIKALWNNIRGGRKPADRNTRLLVRQARAFRDRGDLTLARGTAEQALIYARTPELRREVDSLLVKLSAHGAKHLKTRWDKPGWAPIAQVAPIIIVVLWGSMTLTMNTPMSITDWASRTFSQVTTMFTGRPFEIGDQATVRTDALNLRTGPGRDYQVVTILRQSSVVTVTEISPGGTWVRVVDENGTSGFVPVRTLSFEADTP